MDKDHYCTHSRPGAAQLSTTATASIGAVLTGAVIAAVAALKRIRQRQQVEQQRKKLWPVHAKLGGGGISSGSAGEDSPPASSYRAGSSDSAGSGGLMPPWLQLSEYQDSSARRSSQAMRSILKGTLTAEQAADLCLGKYARQFCGACCVCAAVAATGCTCMPDGVQLAVQQLSC